MGCFLHPDSAHCGLTRPGVLQGSELETRPGALLTLLSLSPAVEHARPGLLSTDGPCPARLLGPV